MVLSTAVLTEFDLVVLTTNYKVFDIELVIKHSNIIVDLRNVVEESENEVNTYKTTLFFFSNF